MLAERRRAALIIVGAVALVGALWGLRAGTAGAPLDRLQRGELGRTGSWWFPRGGPYVLGFDAPAPAELLIDDQQVAVGSGRVVKRVVYASGAHAVTFRGPPGSRLVWHPPGRRGAPEYVPSSSLSPDPPASAHFGGGAGASRGDAAILTLMLLVVCASAVLLARPKLDRRVALLAGGVFALALLVRLWGLGAAGQTWDEDEYWSSGRNYVVNWLSFDFSAASWKANFEHPPVTKYLAGLGALWQDGYGVARFIFAALSAATCALAFAIGRRLFGVRAGVLAGVACALTPHLIAHAQIVGHETPSVFMWTLAVWLALRVGDSPEAMPRRMVWLGVALGLAASTRFANVLVGPVVAIAVMLRAAPPQRLRTLAWGAAVGPAAAVLTFVALWPRMWSHPFAHLDEAWQKLKIPHSLEPFMGHYTTHPPAQYFPVYVLAATPVVLLALALAGGAWRAAARREAGWLIIAAWLLAPFGVEWSPVRQDGVRYVLPVLVPLAIAAAAGLDQLIEFAARFRFRQAAPVLGGAFAVYLAFTCVRIHPYGLDYYNEVIGGAGRAQRDQLFEVSWWGEGIGEAVDYVNAHAADGDRLFKLLQPTHVNWFRADLWQHESPSPAAAEWIVVNDAGLFVASQTGRRFVLPPDAVLVHDVRAGGASLARVYRRQAVLP